MDNLNLLRDSDTMEPLYALLPSGLHPTLIEMAEQMYVYLAEDQDAVKKLGLPRLAEIVVGQIDRVTLHCGGGGFYMPKGIAQRLSARDMEIVHRFNGRNKRELAREFSLTEMRIDQILNNWRRAEFERRQGKLPIGD